MVAPNWLGSLLFPTLFGPVEGHPSRRGSSPFRVNQVIQLAAFNPPHQGDAGSRQELWELMTGDICQTDRLLVVVMVVV